MYSTPQTAGILKTNVMEETNWLPPLQGPNGRDPVVDTWVRATGITATTPNPGAAWLYIRWANSRMANLRFSTRRWQGDGPRAGYARFNYIRNQVRNGGVPTVPGEGYIDAFEKGMAGVPGEHPSVPVDTPQNMNIMRRAAGAMSSVIGGERTANEALDEAATTNGNENRLSEDRVPRRHITDDRFLNRGYGQQYGTNGN